MAEDYLAIQITTTYALEIAKQIYHLEGEILALHGDEDFNFRIKDKEVSYILKVSRPNADLAYLEYQQELLTYLKTDNQSITPTPTLDIEGNKISAITDSSGKTRLVRLLSWIDGRLWSSVNPQNDKLRFSLGQKAGELTKALQGFDHKAAHRESEWDIAQATWTFNYLHLFSDDQQAILSAFQEAFKDIQPGLNELRKSVVHNDANDNNVIVTDDLINPEVKAIIDFGDAIYTPIINDLAITIAYAIMHQPDALAASLPVIKGYHQAFPLQEDELAILHTLVAMRLIISVIKSAISRTKEPDNKYLIISEKPAWAVLEKWHKINKHFATYSFRLACGFNAHPEEKAFAKWAEKASVNLQTMVPDKAYNNVQSPDMSVGSTFLGNTNEFTDINFLAFKRNQIQKEFPDSLLAGGYLEPRAFYSTDAFKSEGNNGPQYRTIHLGIDIWLDAGTEIHSPIDGTVFSVFDNDLDKDYGPTVIIEHKPTKNLTFYSLFGHLSKTSLELTSKGDVVKKGELIGYIGDMTENGHWPPHLHYQVILDMLGNKTNFQGVAFPHDQEVWRSLCPDPNLMFNEQGLTATGNVEEDELIKLRKDKLGKSLSLSYDQPLNIVRGAGAYLVDIFGRKYLDTVNNVAHVGHEHPRVVKAGQEQMAVLNTNTRYLHKNITDFAKELLSTFPEALSVVHFVNSGSEANELALRMTEAYTGQKDMIAVEVGYHGNTNACINISSYKFDGKGGSGAPEYTHIVPLPDTYRGLYKGSDSGLKYAQHIEVEIGNIKSKGRNIAGFICESIISCGGQIELPEEYLEVAYKAVRNAGGLCIADEVQVGCGRIGEEFWGFQLHNVVPDIVTIGKPIGNGHPVAAVVCTKAVADAFANGMEYFNTFGGNPVSCAIGKEVLQVIKSENLQQNALKVGEYLKVQLKKMQHTFPIIGDVRGQGLFLGFELVDKNMKPLAANASYLANRMRDLGILMSTDGKDNNVLKIKPPMVFSIENADELLLRLNTVLAEDFMTIY